jgi:hypothetical protein
MSPENEEMRPEYDFRGGVRGKYFWRTSGSEGLQDALRIQPLATGSTGKHASQSTFQIGAEATSLTLRLEVFETAG